MARPVDKPGSPYDGMTNREKAIAQPRNDIGQFIKVNPNNIQPNPVLHQSQPQGVVHPSTNHPSSAAVANGPANSAYPTAVSQQPHPPQLQGNSYPTACIPTNASGAATINQQIVFINVNNYYGVQDPVYGTSNLCYPTGPARSRYGTVKESTLTS